MCFTFYISEFGIKCQRTDMQAQRQIFQHSWKLIIRTQLWFWKQAGKSQVLLTGNQISYCNNITAMWSFQRCYSSDLALGVLIVV